MVGNYRVATFAATMKYMAKTKPIGVRFDEPLLSKFKEMGISSPQRALNFLEQWYINNIEKVVAFNKANSEVAESDRKETYDAKKTEEPINDEPPQKSVKSDKKAKGTISDFWKERMAKKNGIK